MFPKVSSTKLKYLRGFLPVNKPKGVHCNTLLSCLKKDLNFVIAESGIRNTCPEINYSRPLEPFASGLITIIFGSCNERRRNFAFAEYRYTAVLEFGVERQYDCVDGEIVGFADYRHLTRGLLENSIKDYICEVQQIKPDFVEQSGSFSTSSIDIDIYKLIRFDSEPKPIKATQKYPLGKQLRTSKCSNIKLLEYNPPFTTLTIDCQGSFSIRKLVRDLGNSLQTKASLVELTRVKEGPITLDDDRIISLHDVNLEYYLDRLPVIQDCFSRF